MQPQTRTQQHSRHRRRILLLLVVAFVLGLVSRPALQPALESVKIGAIAFSDSVRNFDRAPASYHSGDAVSSWQGNADPDLYSSAERSRLKRR